MRLANATDHARSLSQSLYTRNCQPRFNGFNNGGVVDGFRDDDIGIGLDQDNGVGSRGRGVAGGGKGENGRRGKSMDPKLHRSSRDSNNGGEGISGSDSRGDRNHNHNNNVGSGGPGERRPSLSSTRMKSASPPRRWRSSSNEPLARFKQQQTSSSSSRASYPAKSNYPAASSGTLARQVKLDLVFFFFLETKLLYNECSNLYSKHVS